MRQLRSGAPRRGVRRSIQCTRPFRSPLEGDLLAVTGALEGPVAVDVAGEERPGRRLEKRARGVVELRALERAGAARLELDLTAGTSSRHEPSREVPPRVFQVVELVAGEGLDALLDRSGGQPWRWVASVVAQLADALHALHVAGYVHCDVKPANAMVLGGGGAPRVKLLDCDLAWRIGAPKEPGVAPGTPRYIPPEHALGVRPTPQTDIYSLGVMAFELLLGTCPLGDTRFFELLEEPVSWPQIGSAEVYAHPASPSPLALSSRWRRRLSPTAAPRRHNLSRGVVP